MSLYSAASSTSSKRKQQRHSSVLDQMYGGGSNEPFQNIRVHTVPGDKPAFHESISQISRELEEVRLIAGNDREEAVRKMNEIISRLTGGTGGSSGSTCIATGTRPAIKAFTPSTDEIQGSVLWNRFLDLVEEDSDIQIIIAFVLTGNQEGKLYSKPLKPDIDHVAFVDRMIDNNKGKKVLDVICELTSCIQQNRFEPLILIFVKCVLSTNKDVERAAYERLTTICDIPPKFFFFVSLCHKYSGEELKGKTFDKMMNLMYLNKLEQKPLESSSSSTRTVNMNSEQQIICTKIDVNRAVSPDTISTDREMIPETRKRVSGKEIVAVGGLQREVKKRNINKHRQQQSKNRIPNILRKISIDVSPSNHAKSCKSSKKLFSKPHLPEGKQTSRWPKKHRIGTGYFYVDPKKTASQLLQFLTKYISGYGWSHKHIIKCTHPKFNCEQREMKNLIVVHVLHSFKKFQKKGAEFLEKQRFIDGESNVIFDAIFTLHEISILSPKKQDDINKLISFWVEYGKRDTFSEQTCYKETKHEYCTNSFHLVFEHIPKGFLKVTQVWEEIMVDLPYHVVLEYLDTMARTKMFEKESNLRVVLSVLSDMKRIIDAKLNPIEILKGLRQYEQRALFKRKERSFVKEIRKTLFDTFHRCLKHPDIGALFACNKRVMLAVDIRQGKDIRSSKCYGANMLSTYEATLAFCMMIFNFEEHCEVHAFDDNFTNLKHLLMKEDMTLDLLMEAVSRLSPRRPDVLNPVEYARRNRIDADVFVVLTITDDFTNRCHEDTLQRYREDMHRPAAKLIVVGMQCHDFTFADPSDPGMYDVCGFNENVPNFLVQITNAV